jgi:pimeloyl-ACP methyl ester carboxylesterase
VLAQLQTAFTLCQRWGQKRVITAQRQPVTSALPTLLLSGEYDPITPTINAKAAMNTLSKSFLFVFPGIGHGVAYTGECPDDIILAFLANPDKKPDGSCIASMSEPEFQ